MKGSKIPIRNVGRGSKPWCVDARYVDGTREHYETKDEAREARDRKLIDLKNHGSIALALTPSERLELIQARDRASKLGTSLSDVLNFFEKHHRAIENISITDAIDRVYHLKQKTNKRERSAEQFRYTLESFARSLPNRTISEIHHEDIERWLYGNGWAPATIRTKLIDLNSFFRTAIKRNWIVSNPAEPIESVELDDRPPGILTVEQCQRLMNSAIACGESRFCGAIALALFCGIRPDEIEKMEMKHVTIERGYAEVPAYISKTRKRRLVDLSENARAWLKVGLELPPVNYRGRLNKTRLSAGFNGYRKQMVDGKEKWISVPGEHWPGDCLRHSFASYHYAFHESEEKTRKQMGHRSSEMLFEHYRELVTREDAAKFWGIMP